VGRSLNNLAQIYRSLGRYDEAKRLYERALAISEVALGNEHLDVAALLKNIGVLLTLQSRYADAEPQLRRSLTIKEKALGGEHLDVAQSLNSLADLYRVSGRGKEAESLYERSLAIREKALGPDHRDVAQSLNNLALLYEARHEYAKAEQYFGRSLAIAERTLGPDHDDVGRTLNNLAGLYFAQQQWTRAADYLRQSADLIIRRMKLGTTSSGPVLAGEGRSEAERESQRFWTLIKASYRVADSEATRGRVSGEMFKAAQWARTSKAATALAHMAARQAKGDEGPAPLVRERQDLVSGRQTPEKLLIGALSQIPDKRNTAAEQEQRTRIATIDARVAEIDIALAKDFPNYAVLASPEPLTIAEVQALLRPDETLVLFLDTPGAMSTPEETFVWIVNNAESRWTRVNLGTRALTEKVAALRCEVDRSAWHGESALLCAKRLNIELDKAPTSGDSQPFDLTRAHELYKALFVPVEDLIKGKHLLIVPSGPLTQIPFHVLVTTQPDPAVTGTEAFRRAAWLAKSNAITVLPSVSSLKALRAHAKTSHATKPFVGFGNPLLDGPDRRYGARAELARAKQQCSKAPLQRVAGSTISGGGMKPLQQRGGLAEVASVRTQVPLPETADELCAVARDLGVPDSDIWLGARANERIIKQLSDSRELASYRIVHFATHGALAGELNAGAEPGLILTPPDEATPEDDGYLSASEVAGLKLDADWVILSACNTAAGGSEGAEALSGLAKAFFYAGARSLLVSHWGVDSDSTVRLITKALAIMSSDKSVGRAEALRRSMLAMIESGDPKEAHPAHWAPFVVVGEGSVPVVGMPMTVEVPRPAKKAAAKSRPKKQAPWTIEIWRNQPN
jgi:CHAT domain-containing protein/Tfp pilus assembly protein PilF